jgi:hypothetical protein
MTDLKIVANPLPSASELCAMLADLIRSDLFGPVNGPEGILDKPIVCALDAPRLTSNYTFRNFGTLLYNKNVRYWYKF